MGEIQELKLILREETSPFFTDEEIAYYLEKNKNSRGLYQLPRYVHNHVLTLGNR